MYITIYAKPLCLNWCSGFLLSKYYVDLDIEYMIQCNLIY